MQIKITALCQDYWNGLIKKKNICGSTLQMEELVGTTTLENLDDIYLS